MKHTSKKGFVSATTHAHLSTGEVIRMLRELKGWTQMQLANHSGISVTNLRMCVRSGFDEPRP